ncbi:hypothetical protein QJS04_geneDACA016660 [Acorus gramineus]|uniref:RRM domain-containing protein n=1 Tax=Acorus gramineus TaxID=55184 RepID=A0AAV9ATT2_ACOGR|nr:hypothetical protein QJS04_geneDACA016660 [Acorus gramineus]
MSSSTTTTTNSLHDARRLFPRLVSNIARHSYRAVEIITLWFWLSHRFPESGLIRQILFMNDQDIESLAVEADLILNSLLLPNPAPTHDDNNDMPITAALLNMQTINTQYCINNCDSVSQGLSATLCGLRWMVFEDLLGQDQMAVAAAIVANENLNWMVLMDLFWANVYNNNPLLGYPLLRMIINDDDEDDNDDDLTSECTLLVTFMRGSLFTEEELREIFTRYGGVEKVVIQETPATSSSLYARIVFHSPMVLYMVLGNSNMVELLIGGKRMWARRFKSE